MRHKKKSKKNYKSFFLNFFPFAIIIFTFVMINKNDVTKLVFNDVVPFNFDNIYKKEIHNDKDYDEDLINSIEYEANIDKSHVLNQNPISPEEIEKLKNLEYLKNSFYIVDQKTNIDPSLFDVEEFLKADLSVETNTDEPKVLVFHTHSSEMYIDSNKSDPMEGIVGVGAYLVDI